MICSDMWVISATRERLYDEIIPASVEHSKTLWDNEEYYAAAHAIDLDLDTKSSTSPGSEGKMWLKVNLAKLNCIQQVIWYYDSNPRNTWTCTSTDCSSCEGRGCSNLLLTTSAEKTSSDNLPLTSDCRYGDTVKLEKVSGSSFGVYEIAITGKQGEITYW